MKRQASCGGHGTFEIRNVTQLLEQSLIPCCVVGVSALMFYGVPRLRDWEICVPMAKVNEAVNMLSQHNEYIKTSERRVPQPLSLAHTYIWFQGSMVDYEFCLVPSTHARIPIGKCAVWRSPNGVPYAPLKELVQSYLDIHDLVSLCDIVDGANLSYEWGKLHLNLDGDTDMDWAQQRNAELMGPEGNFDSSLLCSAFPTAQVRKALLWQKTTVEKKQRLEQMMLPKESFETRYMLKGSLPEPWKERRDSC
ncbi:hypothetical protein CC86DRAFT_169790 [Ophiobolus disseminans]|uniref:Uncharacterized protein n=1 Tax=Ophiobolus disseminans TaxID=1469910 RepID=A0A6A6ZBY6_9PLEO|nr:hypothetical protein CC86DRAFT_169790 [Ophiobolus disseminans]